MGKNMKFNTVEHVKSNLLIMLEAWKEEPRALMVDKEFKMSTRPPAICDKFVYKDSETLEYVKK